MTQRGRTGARPANRRSGNRSRDATDETRAPAAPRIDLVAARAQARRTGVTYPLGFDHDARHAGTSNGSA